MKVFNPLFAAELAKKTGLVPVWILRLTVDDINYDISDTTVVFPAGSLNQFVVTRPWISSWGEVRENISGNIGEILIADITNNILVDEDAADNIKYLALNHELEANPVGLYLWLDGLDSRVIAPQLMFKGYVKDITIPDGTQVNIVTEDETTRLLKYIGNKITSEGFPLCDPDAVGKMIPIVYGSVSKLPALCVDSGWASTLVTDILSTDTSFQVTEVPAASLLGRYIAVDDEIMLVSQPTVVINRVNVASAANGAVASASTTVIGGTLNYSAANTINGDRTGASGPGGGYCWLYIPTAQQGWVEIDFSIARLIDEIDIFSTQLNYGAPVTPTLGMTSPYGPSDFLVQYWNGAAWVTLATVTGNSLVWKTVTFTAVTTTKIRLWITVGSVQSSVYSMITEIEAYSTVANPLPPTTTTTIVVQRAQSGTVAVDHTKGSLVLEKKATPLVYLLADHTLDQIGNIYARLQGFDIDITSDCLKYPAGLSSYPGKAAITIADIVAISKKIALGLENNLLVAQGLHSHPTAVSTVTAAMNGFSNATGSWTSTTGAGGVINNTTVPPMMYDGNPATFARPYTSGSSAKLYLSGYAGSGTPIRVRLGITYNAWNNYGFNNGSATIIIGGVNVAVVPFATTNGPQTIYSGYFTITAWPSLNLAANTYVTVIGNNTLYGIHEVWWEIDTGVAAPPSAATGVALNGTLALSGNSVSDVMVGEMILADCTRNVTYPADVVSNLLSSYCGDNSLIQVGTLPATYKFNGMIIDYRTAIEWLDLLAFQCGCWFRKITGVSKLIVRSATPINPTLISACALTSEGIRDLSYVKAPLTDVINTINVLFNRDWTSTGSSSTAYQKSQSSNDAASIATYGTLEQPNQFMFDFVTDPAMAASLAAFYHDLFAVREWQITVRTFLDYAAMEFGDNVQLGFANEVTGVVISAGLIPGNASQIDTMLFTIATTHIPPAITNAIGTILGDYLCTKDREVLVYLP